MVSRPCQRDSASPCFEGGQGRLLWRRSRRRSASASTASKARCERPRGRTKNPLCSPFEWWEVLKSHADERSIPLAPKIPSIREIFRTAVRGMFRPIPDQHAEKISARLLPARIRHQHFRASHVPASLSRPPYSGLFCLEALARFSRAARHAPTVVRGMKSRLETKLDRRFLYRRSGDVFEVPRRTGNTLARYRRPRDVYVDLATVVRGMEYRRPRDESTVVRGMNYRRPRDESTVVRGMKVPSSEG
jgi:hypothetical protein